MQDLSDFIFINMSNVTLLRWDSNLDFLKPGVKVYTVASLRNSTLHMASLFPDSVISKAEEEIANHDNKRYSGGSHKTSDQYHLYNPSTKQTQEASKKDHQPGNHSALMVSTDKVKARPPTTHSDQPRCRVLINVNYCVAHRGFVKMAIRTETFVDNCQALNINCFPVNHVPFVAGQPKRKA